MFDDDFLSGTALADRLEGVRVADLTDEDVPALAERWEALRSWVEDQQAVVLAELIERSTAVTGGDPALELGAALGVSPTSTWLRLGFAHGLSRLPRLAMMLRDGRIDVARARAVVGRRAICRPRWRGASRRRCWAGFRWTAGSGTCRQLGPFGHGPTLPRCGSPRSSRASVGPTPAGSAARPCRCRRPGAAS